MLYIHGVGHFHPENVIDNSFLESLDIGVDSEWILERVGIQTRHTVLPLDYISQTRNADIRAAREAALYSNVQIGARAAKMALERAGLQASDIGMVVCGGSTTQFNAPAEACALSAELGIDGPAIDLNSSCTSFVAQLHFLNAMRSDALPEFILVVNPESFTRTIDYSDRRNAILFGDGAAAAIVSLHIPSKARVSFTTLSSDTTGWNKITLPTNSYFQQEGSAVQVFAIKKTVATLRAMRNEIPQDHSRLLFIGHQANLLMLQSICNSMKIEDANHFFNVDVKGNCAAAGAPGVLSEHWDEFGAGDVITMALVGAGLTWGGLLIDFQNPESPAANSAVNS